ncbi:uncharacterized protein At5g39865 [Rhododendron vialii]|uniref:uncharacterized protein At5g39865 n=1 Tax=Rhododendron vialii TaxID=182163 RepID=UPI00265E28C8|nr:uncharacterized protein At5g39865 [Rhododendron vialii]
MADNRDEKSGVSGNPNNKSSMYNRSITLTSSEFAKRSYLYNSSLSPLERSGSIKKLYNSSISSFVSAVSSGNSIKGKVKQLCSVFESSKKKPPLAEPPPPQSQLPSLKPAKSLGCSDSKVSSCCENSGIRLQGTEDRVVVYFTSLRGIRRTFEDCCAVRMIIRGFRVIVDERDISMDSAYRKELQGVLGEKNVNLPQVFIRGKYIGGADVIKQLHEVGELAKMLKGLPVRAPGYVCEGCGDVRFIPCSECSGSRKIYDEDEDQLKRCLECNENGLIRCPACCS